MKRLTKDELRYLLPHHFSAKRVKFPQRINSLPRLPNAKIEDEITIQNGERLRLVFESVNSDWAQGVQLETGDLIVVGKIPYKRGVIIFYDPNHFETDIACYSPKGLLWVWNVWDFRPHAVAEPPGSVMSHSNYCGMIVEQIPNGFRYRCNEGRDDDDFDDLTFRVERTGKIDAQPGLTKKSSP